MSCSVCGIFDSVLSLFNVSGQLCNAFGQLCSAFGQFSSVFGVQNSVLGYFDSVLGTFDGVLSQFDSVFSFSLIFLMLYSAFLILLLDCHFPEAKLQFVGFAGTYFTMKDWSHKPFHRQRL